LKSTLDELDRRWGHDYLTVVVPEFVLPHWYQGVFHNQSALALKLALKVRPESVCLVPESREEISTEGGLDVAGQRDRVRAVCEAMRAAGIVVSLFIDADPVQIDAAAELRAPWIELHTGAWANAWHGPRRAEEFARLVAGARQASAAGLVVNAGHGINYVNVAEIRTLPVVHELNIGHSIIARALSTGIEEAVREMKARMNPTG
jgi:pyridoxine 5-phosphate synthase